MPFRRPLQSLCAAFVGMAFMAVAHGQETVSFPIHEDNGSTVEVMHVFSAVPPGGYSAVRIQITNKGRDALQMTVSSEANSPSGGMEHAMSGPTTSIDCPPEATTTKEVIVPMMMDFSSSRHYQGNSLIVALNTSGRSYSAPFRNQRITDVPFWAVSQGLAGVGATDLNSAAHKKRSGSSSSYGGGEKFAASFSPAHLPSDWRAFTGLDGLALTDQEWGTLAPGVRTAIRQWIMLGGLLTCYYSGTTPQWLLQEIGADPPGHAGSPLGLGVVKLQSWQGKTLGASELDWFYETRVLATRAMVASNDLDQGSAGNQAGLAKAMASRSFAAWQVGLILLIFGILVGPVNLFYLAGPGRRHRLFITTPLIALGASVVLLAVIFVQDGAGGEGRRAALIEIHPNDNLSAMRQYQISRTGVLFGGGFTMEEPAVLTPLVLEASRWTRLKPAHSREHEGQQFNMPELLTYNGDWFQSRSEQAQLVETLRPGRGRVELQPGANPPVLTSSLPGKLETVYYRDPGGQWWASRAILATGGTVTLEPASEAEFNSWFAVSLNLFPPNLRAAMTTRDHAGRFYAVSPDPSIGFAATLKSIDWLDDHALVHGRLAPPP